VTPDPRPHITPALEALIDDVIERSPELSGLKSTDILIVGLSAHGTAIASVRSLIGQAKSIVVEKKKRVIELGLRPGFFLNGDAPQRLTTLVHELLHLDAERPGRLLEDRRHANRTHAAHEKEARAIAARYLKLPPPGARAPPSPETGEGLRVLCLAHEGEVLLRQWSCRPAESTRTRKFTDKDVFEGPVQMQTRAGARGGWW